MINAVRSAEEASPKLRQNLAYTYALAGNWRAARVMAAEDVPADQLDARIVEWAATSSPAQYKQRVAAMLGVTPRADGGQPQQLALANFPAIDVMVAEAAAQADMPVMAEAAPSPAPVAAQKMAEAAPQPSFAEAFATPVAAPAPARVAGSVQYVANPVVQQLPAPVASDKGAATHLVQLGAYSSKIEAQRGWTVLKGQFPQLKDHDFVITEAVANGRTFWRVAAAGFSVNGAKSMCGTVKAAGRGCFTYAASSPPAGAVDRGVRVAANTARS
jgi:hypothetical protein